MILRILGLLLLVGALALGAIFKDKFVYKYGSLPEKFQLAVEQDLTLLVESKNVSPKFLNPEKISYVAHGPLTRALLKHAKPRNFQVQKGTYVLEISFHEWEESGELGITATYSLFDLKGNKEDEFGRTYILIPSAEKAEKL